MSSDLLAKNRGSRADILARIKAGLAGGTRPSVAAVSSAAAEPIRPLVLQGEIAGSAALKARFIKFALASSTSVEEVATLANVPAALARYLDENSLPKKAVAWQELAGLDWLSAGLTVEARAANGDDAVGVTGAFCALAETGTLVTLSGKDTAATTSLLPETHIAIVDVSRIVAGMEEAFALVHSEYGQLPRALNFISGPSRTGDIEQTIVLGAHGPRRVHVVLVKDAAAS